MKAVVALNGCVRPIIALVLAAALIYLVVRDTVAPTEFVPIVTFVLGYWFRARDDRSEAPSARA